jgi:hypothetical protein
MRLVLALALASCATRPVAPPEPPGPRGAPAIGVAILDDWRRHDRRHVDVGAPMQISTSGFDSGEQAVSLVRILGERTRVYATVCPTPSDTPRVTLEADLPARFRQNLAAFMEHVLVFNEVVPGACERISVAIEAG